MQEAVKIGLESPSLSPKTRMCQRVWGHSFDGVSTIFVDFIVSRSMKQWVLITWLVSVVETFFAVDCLHLLLHVSQQSPFSFPYSKVMEDP